MIDVTWGMPVAAVQQTRAEAGPKYQQDRQVEHVAPLVQPPLLMSADNPGGWKLEELLDRVRVELQAKNTRLAAGGEFGVDATSTRRMLVRSTVRALNERLIALVMQATLVQQDIQHELGRLGADQGPTGKARV